MGFWSDLGTSFAGNLASGLTDSIFGGITAGRNWKYQSRLMEQQQQYNLQNMAKQYEYSMSAWNAQNKYNDPRNAVARFRAAGINPAAVFGSGSSGAGVAGSMSTPDSSNPSGGGNMDPGYHSPTMTLAEAAAMRNQRRLTDADVDLKEAQAREANSRAEGNENLNSIFGLTKQLKLEEIRDKSLQNDVREIQKGFEEARNIKDIEERQARIDKLVADAQKAIADKSLTEDNRKVLQSIVTLNNAQTGKARAETQTENEMREHRVNLTKAQVRQALSIVGLNDVQLDRDKFEFYLRLLNIDDSGNGVGAVVSKIARHIAAKFNRDLKDYQKIALSEYLEKIWSGEKP